MSDIGIWALTISYERFLLGCVIITAIVVFIIMKFFAKKEKKKWFGMLNFKFCILYLLITNAIGVIVMVGISRDVGVYLLLKPFFSIFIGMGAGSAAYEGLLKYQKSRDCKDNFPM